jgi:hypothetical protein
VDSSSDLDGETLAWAAGLFDGEGCIYIKRRQVIPGRREKTPVYTLEIKVGLVHKPAIEYLASTFRVGSIFMQRPGRLNKRVAWHWRISGRNGLSFLAKIEPYLRIKKPEVEIAIRFIELMAVTNRGGHRIPTCVVIQREDLYQEMRLAKLFEWTGVSP